MALTLNPATKVISVPQVDLTLVSGNLYELDTNQFRKDLWDLLSSEAYIWMPIAFNHNTEVPLGSETFARTIEMINGYSITFENNTYSVQMAGSNNNFFDVENGILNPSGNVTVIGRNSAGLVVVPESGLTALESARLVSIHDAHYNRRKLDKDAKIETLYEDDKITPKIIFDTNIDVAVEGITELIPRNEEFSDEFGDEFS